MEHVFPKWKFCMPSTTTDDLIDGRWPEIKKILTCCKLIRKHKNMEYKK